MHFSFYFFAYKSYSDSIVNLRSARQQKTSYMHFLHVCQQCICYLELSPNQLFPPSFRIIQFWAPTCEFNRLPLLNTEIVGIAQVKNYLYEMKVIVSVPLQQRTVHQLLEPGYIIPHVKSPFWKFGTNVCSI